MKPDDARRLTAALQEKFGGQADAEEVAPGRFRFAILSALFSGVPHLRRQDEVWEVVDAVLPAELQTDLSLILAYSPDEMELSSNP